ncbi:MAG: hypothetical protein V4663_09530 [Bacteroidota bacterium]
MCKLVATLFLVLIATLTLSAQQKQDSILYRKQIQLHAGTQGFGLDLKYGVLPKLDIRIGASSSLAIGVSNVVQLEGLNADNNLTAHFTNIHLIGDFSPFRTRKFRISAGVGYLFQATGNLLFTPTGTYHFDGMELTGEEVGNLTIDLSWKGVAPYLGIGLFKPFASKIFNVNMDLGTYYLNAPKSKITGTKLLADNYQLEPQLDKNMSSYRFLPVIQINFNMNIDKVLH